MSGSPGERHVLHSPADSRFVGGTFLPSDFAESARRDVLLAPPTCCCCCCCCTLVLPEVLMAGAWVRTLDAEVAAAVPSEKASLGEAFIAGLGGASAGFLIGFLPGFFIGGALLIGTGGVSFVVIMVAFVLGLLAVFIRIGHEHAPTGRAGYGGAMGFLVGVGAIAFLLIGVFLFLVPVLVAAILGRRPIRRARERKERGPLVAPPSAPRPAPSFAPYGAAPPKKPPYPPRL